MKTIWIEITCDNCGASDADYYPQGVADELLKRLGWIITKKGLHFCQWECEKSHSSNIANPTRNYQERTVGNDGI